MKSARTTTSRKDGYAPEGDLKFAAKEPLEISICFLGLALSNGKKFAMERLICPHRLKSRFITRMSLNSIILLFIY